jgi:RHS repeat-associated protein
MPHFSIVLPSCAVKPVLTPFPLAHRTSSTAIVIFKFAAWLALICSVPLHARAQVVYDGNQTLPPYGGFSGGQFDIVSLQNGNLHLHIPVGSWQQRGGKTLSLALVSDSAMWTGQTTVTVQNGTQYFFTHFTQSILPALSAVSNLGNWSLVSSISSESCPGVGTVNLYDTFALTDPTGVQHPVDIATSACPTGPLQTQGPTQDGSGMMVNIGTSPMLTLKDGTRIPLQGSRFAFFSVSQEDTNGNLIGTTDTLGRTPWTTTEGPVTTLITPLGAQIQTPAYQMVAVTDSSGNAQSYRIDYTAIDVVTTFCGTSNNPPYHRCTEPSTTYVVPSKVTLPSGAVYQFSWINSTPAELGSIALPTGGLITYGYTSGCLSAPPMTGVVYPPTSCRAEVASRTVTVSGTNSKWTYSSPGSSVTVTDPLNNQQVHVFSYPSVNSIRSAGSVETQVSYYQGSATGTPLKRVVTNYTGEKGFQVSGTSFLANIRPISITTTLGNGRVSQTQTDYETFTFNGQTWTRTNPSEIREYDFGSGVPGPLLRRTDYTYLHNSNSTYATLNIVDRIARKTIYDGNNNQMAQTTNEYDNYSHAKQPMVASNAVRHDSNFGTAYVTRGNLTAVSQWNNANGSLFTTTNQYDDAGNALSTIDPLGNTTSFGFTDAWSNSTCAPSGQGKAYLTTSTNALSQVTSYTYDSCTGFQASTTDPNLRPTSQSYDMMGRVTGVSYPDGGSTTHCYTDVGGTTCTQSGPPYNEVTTKAISSSLNAISTTTFDGLGRLSQTQLNSDPSGTTYTFTTYDGLGRVSKVYNPTRCSSITSNCNNETTWGYTAYTYDALGRTTQVTEPDNSTVVTIYTGRAAEITDEGNGTARAQRISQVDGLGRLTSVCEVTGAPQLGSGGTPGACGQDIAATGFLTTYGYDALGNLLAVNQGTLGQRTFAYDSLSRLLCAANPETGSATCPNPDNGTYTAGTTRYAYDANGNLVQRTRPAPNQTIASTTVATTYAHDTLNRVTQESYSDGVTLPVYFGYDQTNITMGSQQFTIANSIGRLSWTCVLHNSSPSCPSMTANSYDFMGRIAELWQSNPVNNNNIWISYKYDLLGDETNRDLNGATDAATYSGAGRLTSFTATDYTDATNPANLLASALYDPFGHLVSATLANALTTESWGYDNRGRPQAMAVGTTCSGGKCTGSTAYSYSVTNPSNGQTGYAPNGDILFASDTVNGNWTYTYDGFNRISTGVATNGKGCSWDYDRYGNRWHQNAYSGSCSAPQFSFSGNNNRLDGYSYDAAGNLLNDGTHNYIYDPENRIISVDNGATTYTYDADGKRVAKTTAGTLTDIIYDREGHIILYNTPSPAGAPFVELYVAGMHVGTYEMNSTVTDTIFYYDHADWLGTERARTNLAGTACETIASLPFGDGQTISGSCGDISHMHFTGKERDAESGLDDFGARYYASSLGRFMKPDPNQTSGFEHMRDPQSWNGYSIARNNPLVYVDPDGLNYRVCDTNGNNCADLTNDQYNQYLQSIQGTNTTVNSAGQIQHTNDNGSVTNLGTASYYNEKDIQAAQMLVQTGVTLSDPRTIAGFYGASALLGVGFYAAGAYEAGFTGLELSGGGELLTNKAAGEIIGWGTGQEGVAATEQLTNSLTKKAVGEMVDKGLTKSTVQRLAFQYDRAMAEEGIRAENLQLGPRLQLMIKIIELWPK